MYSQSDRATHPALPIVVALMIGVTLSVARPGTAQPTRTSTAPAGWPAYVTTFDSASRVDSIVGARTVVIDDGRVVASHDYGFANAATREPADSNTIFHWASITKTMTAIGIMQLRDRGKLSLDDRVVDYIPELRLIHDPYGSIDSITIRMVMSHSAGFMDPTWPYKRGLPWEPWEPTTWNQLVAMMPYQELEFRPGSQFGYSNPGFIYLGRIIEILTGDPWENYIQKNILSPLGLTRSYFGVTPYYLAVDRSHNYDVVRDSATGRDTLIDNGSDFDPGITMANGGWNSSLGDMVRYVAFLTGATHGDAALQRRYDTVLRHASLEEMWRPMHSMGPVPFPRSMGMSFFISGEAPHRVVGHTGHQAGFASFVYFNPESKRAVTAAFNTNNHTVRGDDPQARFHAIVRAAVRMIR